MYIAHRAKLKSLLYLQYELKSQEKKRNEKKKRKEKYKSFN